MLRILTLFAACFCCLLLMACSDEPQSSPPPIKPFEVQTGALEQTKQLEQNIQALQETQRKEMEAPLQ